MAAVIEVESLAKRFGDRVVVDGVSFVVRSGRVAGFLGPNGAGKTTTLRMILGLLRPDSGTARVNGVAFAEVSEPGRVVGAVLESSGFAPECSGQSHLRWVAAALGVSSRRVLEVLEEVGLSEAAKEPVKSYSLGMRQRLGIAGALLGDPQVLILDEPTNGLDPAGVRWLREMRRERATAGGTVLLSSHLLSEVAQTVDDVVVLNRGRVLANAPLKELTDDRRAAVRLRSPEPAQLAEILGRAGIRVELSGPDSLLALGASSERIGDLLKGEHIAIYEMAAQASTLEDLFFEITGSPEGLS